MRVTLCKIGLIFQLAIFSLAAGMPFTGWHRVSSDPIISPQGDSWEAAGTFNPAVVRYQGKFVMLYRAQDKNGTSRLGYAESTRRRSLHSSRPTRAFSRS